MDIHCSNPASTHCLKHTQTHLLTHLHQQVRTYLRDHERINTLTPLTTPGKTHIQGTTNHPYLSNPVTPSNFRAATTTAHDNQDTAPGPRTNLPPTHISSTPKENDPT